VSRIIDVFCAILRYLGVAPFSCTFIIRNLLFLALLLFCNPFKLARWWFHRVAYSAATVPVPVNSCSRYSGIQEK
jgi:hypothetical protein